MRRLLLALALVLLASPAYAAIAHVQTVTCNADSVHTCTTAAITSTTGNLFVTASGHYTDGTNTAISDSKGNVYSLITAELTQTNLDDVRLDAKEAGTGGASHTFTWTSSDSFYGVIAATEISGMAASSVFDKTAGVADSGASHSSGSTAATTQANELLYGAGLNFQGVASVNDGGAGWIERANVAGDGVGVIGIIVGTRVVSATGTYAYTFTSAGSNTAQHIATWKELVAASNIFRNQGDLTGLGTGGKFHKDPSQ